MVTPLTIERNHGTQVNYNQSGGSLNHQFNAVTIHFQHNLSPNNSRAETPPLPFSTAPFSRNPHFAGRNLLMDEISQQLSVAAARVALVGLGGIGKTQLALEYTYMLQEQSPSTFILWLNARSLLNFEQSVRDTIDGLKIPGRNDPKVDPLMLLSSWLLDRRKGRWVIVLDDVVDANFLIDAPVWAEEMTWRPRINYIPVCDHGSVLITSRNKIEALKLVDTSNLIEIPLMDKLDAVTLIHRTLGLQTEVEEATELAHVLHYHPLAIAHASAWIKRSPRASVQSVLQEFKLSISNDASAKYRPVFSPSNSIMLALQISFEHILKTRKSAAEILCLMSFCDPEDIPETLLRSHHANTDPYEGLIRDGNNDSQSAETGDDTDFVVNNDGIEDFEADVTVLRDSSFISLSVNNSKFQMHRLVQLAIRNWLEMRDELEPWKELYIHNLWTLFPTTTHENWTACQTYFPHAKGAAELKLQSREARLKWASVMYRGANFALALGRFRDAEKMSQLSFQVRAEDLGEQAEDTLSSLAITALAKKELGQWGEAERQEEVVMQTMAKIFGEEYRGTLEAMARLATTYRYQGRLDEAEELDASVLSTSSRMLGDEHPDTNLAAANLASTYRNQGKLKEAERLQLRVLKSFSNTLGESHPSTLTAMANLANTYSAQGLQDQASVLAVEVLEGRLELFGNEAPLTITARANLAAVYWNQGKWLEARELQEKVTDARSKVLGGEHPDTLTALSFLASIQRDQGQWDEAEAIEMKVMAARLRVLGDEHPDTLSSTANLASLRRNQGRLAEAEKLEKMVVEASLRVLGEEHPGTLTATTNLAAVYADQGKWYEAEKVQVKATETSRKVLGNEHPNTLSSMANLASIYWNQRRWTEAEKLEVEVIEISRKVLGAEHPKTLIRMTNLSSTYQVQGRLREAETLLLRVLDSSRRIMGNEHPDTLNSIAQLASTYASQGRWKDAQEFGMQLVETRKKVLGVEHPATLTSITHLASAIRHQGQWKEAETLEKEVIETTKRVWGEEHPATLKSFFHLASILADQKRWDEAEQLVLDLTTKWKTLYGHQHPSILKSFVLLASIYLGQDQFLKAERVLVEAVGTFLNVLGESHPETLNVKAKLALSYMGQARWEEAATLNADVLNTWKTVLGEHHPNTVSTMHSLALSFKGLMRLELAEKLEKEVLNARLNMFGASHPDTQDSYSTLAWIREAQNPPPLSDQSSSNACDDDASLSHPKRGSAMSQTMATTMSLSGGENQAVKILTDCLLSDDLRSTYEKGASKLRREHFLKSLTKAMKSFFHVLRDEAPFLRSRVAFVLRSESRRRRIAFNICERLQLYKFSMRSLLNGLNEKQTAVLSSKTIGWVEDVFDPFKSEKTALPYTAELLEDPTTDNGAGIESESTESEDEPHEDHQLPVDSDRSFIQSSKAFASYRHSLERALDPVLDFEDSLSSKNVGAVHRLLCQQFALIACGPWEWLQELIQIGYEMNEIADLLVTRQIERPWIHFEPPQAMMNRIPLSDFHLPGCVHRYGQSQSSSDAHNFLNVGESHSTLSNDEDDHESDICKTVASFCGLAGVAPADPKKSRWNGEVLLEQNSAARVTYHTEGASQSTLLTRIRCALDGFCSAAAEMQQRRKCCDSFTALRFAVMTPPEHQHVVETCNIRFDLAISLSRKLQKASGGSDPAKILNCVDEANQILSNFDHDWDIHQKQSARGQSVEGVLHICALAVQALCLGYVSYFQAHTGSLQLFFLEHPIEEVLLCGSGSIDTSSSMLIGARLQELTCIASMLRAPVFCFYLRNRGNWMIDDTLPSQMDILASPQDFIDTWGPGNFVVSPGLDNEPKIIQIIVGGGIVTSAGASEDKHHWIPTLRMDSASKPTMCLTEKILIGATIKINVACQPAEDACFRKCDAYCNPLGTFESYWELAEQQAGLQAGQYASLIFNRTWAKRSGTTLKETEMLRPLYEVISFLESTWGLQVSFCSGLARRVKMRELLADLLPTFVGRRTPFPTGWSVLRDTHEVLQTFREGDLKSWFDRVSRSDNDSYELICVLIRSITLTLHDTGLDPSGREFVVAWIPSQSSMPLQCIKFPTHSANFWTKALRDSSDCATFAYFTTSCLEMEGRGCRSAQTHWHGEMLLAETEVHRHIDRSGKQSILTTTWTLEHGEHYPIGRLEAQMSLQLKARVERSAPSLVPYLVVTPGGIPIGYVKRILHQKHKAERLRERLTPLDRAERVFIVSESGCSFGLVNKNDGKFVSSTRVTLTTPGHS